MFRPMYRWAETSGRQGEVGRGYAWLVKAGYRCAIFPGDLTSKLMRYRVGCPVEGSPGGSVAVRVEEDRGIYKAWHEKSQGQARVQCGGDGETRG